MSLTPKYTLIAINYWPEPTGNAPYNTALAQKLAESGGIQVITGIPHYPWWEKQRNHSDLNYLNEHPNLQIARVNHFVPKRQSNLTRAAMEIEFGLRTIAALRLSGGKVILVSPAMFSSAIVLAWIKLCSRKTKVVLWVQDLYEQGLQETNQRKALLFRLVVRTENWLLRNADRVVMAHPRFLGAKGLDTNNEKFFTLANWSQFKFSPSEDLLVTKQKLGLSGSKVILHIGNMGVKQGLEHVLAAAAIALKSYPTLKFVFVGGGNQQEKLAGIARDGLLTNVVFVPPVSEQELSNLLNAADVLLVHEAPGVREMSVPSKLTTYYLTGRPVIVCSESDSLSAKAIQDNGTGFWVQSGNPKSLLNGIDELGLQEGLLAANRARVFAEENLGEKESLNRFTDLVSNF